MLESITSLDFSRSLAISDKADDLDAVASGLNMLCEELSAHVVQRSELKKAVSELEVANQELWAFGDALAHDLRHPLLIVTNFSHQLHESLGKSLTREDADDLERIRSAGRHMVRVIDDIRDLGEVARAQINRSEVDLSALGQHIMDDLRAQAPDRDVRFEVEPEVTAYGDMTLLRILLTKLLQNAWKFTGPRDDAWIEVGVAEANGDVPIYHVRDNGIGFDNANSKVIFQAFERLHNKTEFAGSGLGLAIVMRIVRRHGGRVWAEGVPAEGAVFHFTLGSPSPNRRRRPQPHEIEPTTQHDVAPSVPVDHPTPGAGPPLVLTRTSLVAEEEPARALEEKEETVQAPKAEAPPPVLTRTDLVAEEEPAQAPEEEPVGPPEVAPAQAPDDPGEPPATGQYTDQLLFSTSKCEVATGKSGRRCLKPATHTRDGRLLCERHADLQEAGEKVRWAVRASRKKSSKCQSLTKAGKRCPKWGKFVEADKLYCPSHASDEIKARER